MIILTCTTRIGIPQPQPANVNVCRISSNLESVLLWPETAVCCIMLERVTRDNKANTGLASTAPRLSCCPDSLDTAVQMLHTRQNKEQNAPHLSSWGSTGGRCGQPPAPSRTGPDRSTSWASNLPGPTAPSFATTADRNRRALSVLRVAHGYPLVPWAVVARVLQRCVHVSAL